MPLSNEIKQAALVGLRYRRDELGAQIAGLERELGGSLDGQPAPRKKRRRMSAAGRKRIAEAQRKRWAAVRAQQEVAAAKKTTRRAAVR
jgi:hypothetical protein